MSQVLKLILRFMLDRIKKLKREITEEQYDFEEGKGTRNSIFILRMLCE